MSNHGSKSPDSHCDHNHSTECENCGAAKLAGLAECTYCHAAYPGVSAGIECVGCRATNEKGRQQCACCGASLMAQCVFCNAFTPCDQPACSRCHEAFKGAAERKRARDQAARAPGLSPMAHKNDPSGSAILGSLADILKS